MGSPTRNGFAQLPQCNRGIDTRSQRLTAAPPLGQLSEARSRAPASVRLAWVAVYFVTGGSRAICPRGKLRQSSRVFCQARPCCTPGFPICLPQMAPLYTREPPSARNSVRRTIVQLQRPSPQPTLTWNRSADHVYREIRPILGQQIRGSPSSDLSEREARSGWLRRDLTFCPTTSTVRSGRSSVSKSEDHRRLIFRRVSLDPRPVWRQNGDVSRFRPTERPTPVTGVLEGDGALWRIRHSDHRLSHNGTTGSNSQRVGYVASWRTAQRSATCERSRS